MRERENIRNDINLWITSNLTIIVLSFLEKDITKWLVGKQTDCKEEDIEFEVDIKTINNKKYSECYAVVGHAYGVDTYIAFSLYNDENLPLDVNITTA